MSVICQMSDDGEFHTVGPATENTRSPNLMTVGGSIYVIPRLHDTNGRQTG